MTWAHLYAYIMAIAPDLAEDLVGVPEEHILACENGLNLELPPAYREFLLTMGVDAGRFYPLGQSMEWNFYELLRDLPAEDYSPQEFFRVGTDEFDDSRITSSEFYLDMATVDERGDCDLLRFAFAGSMTVPLTYPTTFLERVAEVAWLTLHSTRFPHRLPRAVWIYPRDVKGLSARKAAVVAVLRRAGFNHSLPPARQLDVLAASEPQPVTACIETTEHGIWIHLAGESERTLSRLVQLLLDNVEDCQRGDG